MNDLPVHSREIVTFADFFPKYPLDKAHLMAQALQAYCALGFVWDRVVEQRVICRKTLHNYLNCPEFLDVCRRLGPLQLAKAVDVYHKALDEAPWSDRIRAADRVTQYHDSGWDPHVRKARAQGNILTKLLSEEIDEQKAKEIDAIEARLADKETEIIGESAVF